MAVRGRRDVRGTGELVPTRVERLHGEGNPRAIEALDVDQRQAELVDGHRAPTSTLVSVDLEVRVPTNHAGQVSAAVLRTGIDRRHGPAETEEAVVGRQVRALTRAAHGAGDVLPASPGEEAMVPAGDDLGPVRQRRPDTPASRWTSARGPPSSRSGGRCPASRCRRCDHPRADRRWDAGVRRPAGPRIPGYAVHARMRAAPVRIDGPREWHRRFARHVVERALGPHLVERQPGELRHLHAAQQPADARHAGQRRRLLEVEPLRVPSHDPCEHMFEQMSSPALGLRSAGGPRRRWRARPSSGW